jgi:hypothetical protein
VAAKNAVIRTRKMISGITPSSSPISADGDGPGQDP